eukprot:PhF_6_TR24318/c0_g1_i1/m.33752
MALLWVNNVPCHIPCNGSVIIGSDYDTCDVICLTPGVEPHHLKITHTVPCATGDSGGGIAVQIYAPTLAVRKKGKGHAHEHDDGYVLCEGCYRFSPETIGAVFYMSSRCPQTSIVVLQMLSDEVDNATIPHRSRAALLVKPQSAMNHRFRRAKRDRVKDVLSEDDVVHPVEESKSSSSAIFVSQKQAC